MAIFANCWGTLVLRWLLLLLRSSKFIRKEPDVFPARSTSAVPVQFLFLTLKIDVFEFPRVARVQRGYNCTISIVKGIMSDQRTIRISWLLRTVAALNWSWFWKKEMVIQMADSVKSVFPIEATKFEKNVIVWGLSDLTLMPYWMKKYI